MSYNFDIIVGNQPAKIYRKPAKNMTDPQDLYIEGRKGSEYSLKFDNLTSERVLAIFSVDGLDTVDGKPAGENSRGYVVEPWQTITVPGWTINSSKVAKFEFRPQGDSENTTYVEALKKDGINVDAGNQGVIGVMVIKQKTYPKYYGFHITQPWETYKVNPAWTGTPKPMPMSYNASFSVGSASIRSSIEPTGFVYDSYVPEETAAKSSMGTGFGRDETFNTKTATFERDLNALIWTRVYTYDTLTNLRKMGVMVDEPKPAMAKAFPGGGCHVPSNRV